MLEILVIIWIIGGFIANGFITASFDMDTQTSFSKGYRAKMRLLAMLKSWYSVGYTIGVYMIGELR